MIERRKVYEVALGDGSKLYRIVLEGQESLPTGAMSTMIKAGMLKAIGENLDLVSAENTEFESLEFSHKNGHWTLVARVIKPL
jgi:hypothetical protein